MHQLFKPINNASLAAFRILFGLLIATELRWEWAARVDLVQQRPIRFPYLGFEWLTLLPTGWGEPFLYSLAACCLLISLGLCFRPAAIAFTVGYTWMFLLDRAYFNNHNYLICMLGGWLAVSDAHRRWSVDAWLRPAIRSTTVPTWQLAGIIGQIGVAYFFGGVAKINPDWLRGEPMRYFLYQLIDTPVLSIFAEGRPLALVFAWGGMLFDLLIVPALLWRRTRLAAFAAFAFFHVMNANMFSIGIFPWLSMGSLVLFLPPTAIEQGLAWLRRPFAAAAAPSPPSEARRQQSSPFACRLITAAFILWFAVQCLVPLRRFLLPGNVGWTREGFYFAWTMKLNQKSCFLQYQLYDPSTDKWATVNQAADLTAVQNRWLPTEPRGIARYAQFLSARATEAAGRPIVVVCDAIASLNGRPYQYVINPSIDIAKAVAPRWRHADWIVPLAAEAPIGTYANMTQKPERIRRLVNEIRVARGIFPPAVTRSEIRDESASQRDDDE